MLGGKAIHVFTSYALVKKHKAYLSDDDSTLKYELATNLKSPAAVALERRLFRLVCAHPASDVGSMAQTKYVDPSIKDKYNPT